MLCQSFRALAAATLGLATAALIAACGASSGLLGSGQASGLKNRLEAVVNAVGNGDCASATTAANSFSAAVANLPASVDGGLKSDLERAATKLTKDAQQRCQASTSPAGPTPPKHTTTHPHTTSTHSSTQPPSSTTTPIPSRPTTPATTTGPSGTTSGGAGIGGGGTSTSGGGGAKPGGGAQPGGGGGAQPRGGGAAQPRGKAAAKTSNGKTG
jgi:hypothetical protein